MRGRLRDGMGVDRRAGVRVDRATGMRAVRVHSGSGVGIYRPAAMR